MDNPIMTDSNPVSSSASSKSLSSNLPANLTQDSSVNPLAGSNDTPPERQVGRNEDCPCGSGKKYKRCHGVGAAPKLTQPKAGVPGAGFNPGALPPDAAEMMKNMDPAFMKNMMNIMSRVPKGQLQRLQIMMQKAAKGEDVTREAADLERVMPQEFTALMRQAAMSSQFASLSQAQTPAAEGVDASTMSVEEARRIVENAAKEGKIEQEKAAEVLTATESLVTEDKKSGLLGKLFGKKK
jgi:hypothetical protein